MTQLLSINTVQFSKKTRFNTTINTALLFNVVMGFAIFLMVTGCEQEVDPVRQFVTPKGSHYSLPRVSQVLQNQRLSFDARFNSTAKYNLGDPALQSSKNKLMGFCDCNSLPHENSARFTWQWFNDRLEIYAYCYVNGDRNEEFIGVVDIDEYNHYELELTSDSYIFRLNNLPAVIMKRGSTCNTGAYFKLWPYFGGQIPAPHDVAIDIRTNF